MSVYWTNAPRSARVKVGGANSLIWTSAGDDLTKVLNCALYFHPTQRVQYTRSIRPQADRPYTSPGRVGLCPISETARMAVVAIGQFRFVATGHRNRISNQSNRCV